MPCYDAMANLSEAEIKEMQDRRLSEELAFTSAVLCELISDLTPESVEAMPEKVKSWWSKHRQFDINRLTKEIKEVDDKIIALNQTRDNLQRTLDGIK